MTIGKVAEPTLPAVATNVAAPVPTVAEHQLPKKAILGAIRTRVLLLLTYMSDPLVKDPDAVCMVVAPPMDWIAPTMELAYMLMLLVLELVLFALLIYKALLLEIVPFKLLLLLTVTGPKFVVLKLVLYPLIVEPEARVMLKA